MTVRSIYRSKVTIVFCLDFRVRTMKGWERTDLKKVRCPEISKNTRMHERSVKNTGGQKRDRKKISKERNVSGTRRGFD